MLRIAAKGLFHPKIKAWRARLPLEQTSEMGHLHRSDNAPVTSAYPSIADVPRGAREAHVCPQAPAWRGRTMARGASACVTRMTQAVWHFALWLCRTDKLVHTS
jgi:hypothetical protein